MRKGETQRDRNIDSISTRRGHSALAFATRTPSFALNFLLSKDFFGLDCFLEDFLGFLPSFGINGWALISGLSICAKIYREIISGSPILVQKSLKLLRVFVVIFCRLVLEFLTKFGIISRLFISTIELCQKCTVFV